MLKLILHKSLSVRISSKVVIFWKANKSLGILNDYVRLWTIDPKSLTRGLTPLGIRAKDSIWKKLHIAQLMQCFEKHKLKARVSSR